MTDQMLGSDCENAVGLNAFPPTHSIFIHGVVTKVKQKTRFRVQMLA